MDPQVKVQRILDREALKKTRKEQRYKKRMDRLTDPTLFRNRFEFSKFITIVVILIFTAIALWSMVEYYQLVELAIRSGALILPDATLPVTAITTIIGSVLTYLVYAGSLKLSLNKHGLRKDYRSGTIRSIIAHDIGTIIDAAVNLEEQEDEKNENESQELDRSQALAGEPVLEEKDD